MIRPSRRGVVTGLAAAATIAGHANAAAQEPKLVLSGRAVQGGSLIGKTSPRALISLDGEAIGKASARGFFIVGFDRDAKAQATIRITTPEQSTQQTVQIAAGDFDIQRIDGLPQDQVAPQDAALLARIAAESARKAIGFASIDDSDDFQRGFVMPLAATRVSGRFGGQRILNGQPSRPHYGADLAAPLGTVVRAPAPGLVSFAETGLHFEGGLILIDHGQGLITAYLHLSKVDVKAGQHVGQGQKIGEVGKEGRATGPHLCWRMKWRGRNLDPTLLVDLAAPRN